MIITINVPGDPGDDDSTDAVVDYIQYVASQIEDGCTSGHVDSETNWEMTRD